MDDGLICTTQYEATRKILDNLKTVSEVVEGPVGYFVDFQVQRNMSEKSVLIHQARYITGFLIILAWEKLIWLSL